MTDAAQSLLISILVVPLLGAVCGLAPLRPRSSIESLCASLGVLGSAIAAVSLAALLRLQGRPEVEVTLWRWMKSAGTRTLHIDFGLQLNQWAAMTLAVLPGLAWLTMRLPSRSDGDSTFKIGLAVIVFAINGMIASVSLVQMFAFWLLISAGILMMAAWSPTSTTIGAMRRMLVLGLFGDLLLLWIIMLIGLAGGSNSFVDIRATSLGRLALGNPALPELVCSLIVLSSLSRCGAFPLFGWNSQAAHSDTRSCIAVYAIGYVPAGVWMLLKCQPLLATSETALSMLSGLGLLAAVLGAFVACAQTHMHQRIGFLVGSQIGLVLAALSSGSSEAVTSSIWHQLVVSIAAFLVLIAAGHSVAPRTATVASWTGVMAFAGLFPCGGWTQSSLIEIANRPRVVSAIQIDRPDGAADATEPTNALWRMEEDSTQTRLMRTWGLVAAQAMSAFAIARGFAELARQRSVVSNEVSSPTGSGWIVGIGVVLLLTAGPLGCWLSAISLPGDSDGWLRWAIAEGLAVIGLAAGWWSARSATTVASGVSRWEPLARLSREQLYLEQSFRQLIGIPWQIIGWLSLRALNAATNAQAWRTLTLHSIGRLGNSVEGLHVSRTDFYVATILLGTATILVTLFLIV